MPYLYLFIIKNVIDNNKTRNVAVLCKKKEEYSYLKIGMITKLFDKNRKHNDIIERINIIFLFGLLYNDIITRVGKNYTRLVHRMNGEYYITIDNYIWRLNYMVNMREYEEFIEYNELMIFP